MKNIILIRHAKSNWDLPLPDKERTIIKSGIKKSIKVADKAVNCINPSAIIWCSSAKRTLLTAEIFLKVWNLDQKNIVVIDNLYTFDCLQLEEIVKSCPNQCENLILFGHNSAITDFVNKFGNKFVTNVPTSGFVSINFDTTSWATITKGTTQNIIFPSEN
ncbi:SixA phosphatase family protein [Flavobacterium sp.]|jgi:phosphohistidine phosphatase|uniref:SixA phosphatase family protein n=1 Tax=Flavobacterium sp. TaxID=239 RepID=UPI0037C130AB